MTRSAGRSAGVAPFAVFVVLFLALFGCAADRRPVELGWTPDSPAVYRVSVGSESRFSGPVSDLFAETRVSAVLRVTPLSPDRAEVEVLRFGASTSDSPGGAGEAVGLSMPDVTGKTVTVRFSPPGVVSGIGSGPGDGPSVLDAPVPLVSGEDLVRAVFPPLPEGSFGPSDTWTGVSASPFPNLGEEPVRMRYVVLSAGEEPEVSGYELSTRPRSFDAQTATDRVTGRGRLDVEFTGTLDRRGGYGFSERRTTFGSDFLELGGGGFANGGLRLTQTLEVRRLDAFEQFGLDAVPAE